MVELRSGRAASGTRDESRAPSPSEPSRPSGLAIVVNGDDCVVHADCTLHMLLDELGMSGRRLAVARNRQVVPRSRYALEPLAAGDRVEILEAVGGG